VQEGDWHPTSALPRSCAVSTLIRPCQALCETGRCKRGRSLRAGADQGENVVHTCAHSDAAPKELWPCDLHYSAPCSLLLPGAYDLTPRHGRKQGRSEEEGQNKLFALDLHWTEPSSGLTIQGKGARAAAFSQAGSACQDRRCQSALRPGCDEVSKQFSVTHARDTAGTYGLFPTADGLSVGAAGSSRLGATTPAAPLAARVLSSRMHCMHPAQLPKLQNCSQLPTLLLEHAPTCTSPYMNPKARTDQAGGMQAQAVPTDPKPDAAPRRSPHAAVPQPRLPQATVAPLPRRRTAVQSGGRAVRPQADSSPGYALRCALWPAAAAPRASGVLCTAPPSERYSVVTCAHAHVRKRLHARPPRCTHISALAVTAVMRHDAMSSPRRADRKHGPHVSPCLAWLQCRDIITAARHTAACPAATPRHRPGAGPQVTQPTAGAAAMPGCA